MRAVLNMFLVVAVTAVYCAKSYISRLYDATGDPVVECARHWSQWICRLGGIRVVLRQQAPLAAKRPYVFMANHTSAADIWAIYAVLPVPVRMLAKKQIGRIPFLGWAMRAGRYIFIDRDNPQAARRSIDEAARRIANGDAVLLFPEGTRSRNGKLAEFKKGGFHLAMNAGVEIVPIGVRGTFNLLPPGSFFPRPGTVEVIVGAPIPTKDVAESKRAEFIAGVHEAVAALIAG